MQAESDVAGGQRTPFRRIHLELHTHNIAIESDAAVHILDDKHDGGQLADHENLLGDCD
jgi:hypothetical protein